MNSDKEKNNAYTVACDTDSEDSDDLGRDKWANKAEFLLSIIGYSVGAGNLWRFPYICVRNGGGAFLIPFFMFLLLCGIPLFFMELSLGQFSGTSALPVWKICPLFKGLGLGMVMITAILSVYYNVVIGWMIYFLANSFFTVLPWSTCGNWWNSVNCMSIFDNETTNGSTSLLGMYETNRTTLQPRFLEIRKATDADRVSSADEFWHGNVLHVSSGIEDLGIIQWRLLLCLLAAWVLVFICLSKGVKSVGKVVYVTVTMPYLLLTVFLIRGAMLPGALDGIKYYITPDFNRLMHFQVWIEACLQVFYSLGPAWGSLITMASYNKFRNNCLRDAVIATLADGLTSFYAGFVIFCVLGFMAHQAGVPVADVLVSGPGTAFVAYPEAIAQMPLPQLWAVLFFLMLLMLGIDTQFGMVETLSSGLVDVFPQVFKNRRIWVTLAISVIGFLLGFPFITSGGIFVFQLVDWYSAAYTVLLISFLECIIVGWIYGSNRMSQDIYMMVGRPLPAVMRICWCFITPTLMLTCLVFTMVRYEPPTYNNYKYPSWSNIVGFGIAMLSVLPMMGVTIYQIIITPGSIRQRFATLLRPEPSWGPSVPKLKAKYAARYHQRETSLRERVRSNIFGTPEEWVYATEENHAMF